MTDNYSDRRVLVADDETVVADALAGLARNKFGCTVDVVYSGDDALVRLAEESYDLFITDMQMPGQHGLGLIRRVSALWADTQILVTTGYPQDFPYVDSIRAGAADFIVKPYRFEEMHAKVLRLFKERDAREAAVARNENGVSPEVAAEAKFRSVFDFNVSGMLILDTEEYRITDVNQAFARAAGASADALTGERLFELFEPASSERMATAFQLFAQNGEGALGDVWLERNGGGRVCMDLSVSFIRLESDHFVQVSSKDVTDQQELQEQLATFAQTDPLTGLLNRRMLHVQLEGAVMKAKRADIPATLLFMDLDYFKQCNDTQGHQKGDELLKLVGDLIRKHTRANTDTGYRYGGDEFAILLTEADKTVGARVGERIRAEYAEEDRCGTSMSIGVTQHTDEMDATAFVKAADAALYAAKSAGKNQVSVT
ncbi:MAG: diguanylate cyclase [bacterium]|nr:diguanylate cyclase [bacterium]